MQVLAQDFMSDETLSVLRANFSPSFNVDETHLRSVINVLNKLKNTLQEDTYCHAVGLLLQYNTSKTTEKSYDRILVENRLLHILREYEGLRFELLDVLHNTTDQAGNVLASLQSMRIPEDSLTTEGNIEMNVVDVCNITSSSSNDIKTEQLASSREFGLSRQLYQKIPTSLHHSNVENASVSDEEMPDVASSGKPIDDVQAYQHLDVSAVNDISDEYNAIANIQGSSKEKRCGKRKLKCREMSSEEVHGGESERETGWDEQCSAGEDVEKEREGESSRAPSSRKRARRLGAREDDMMLKQVGSHCIVIGVKEHAMATDSSDYNTQSEPETAESESMASQEEVEQGEGALVIAEDKHPNMPKTTPKRKRKSRPGKASNMVNVSSLCRGASAIEKRGERNMNGQNIKTDQLKKVLKNGIQSIPKSNANNSCSASEFSDEDVLGTYLENHFTDDSSPIGTATTDEKTVLDILSSSNSASKNQLLLQGVKSRYPDVSASIVPFTKYLGLRPIESNGDLWNSSQESSSSLLTSDNNKSKSTSAKPQSKSSAGKSQTKSSRPKYNPHFPFSTAAFSAMSSIAEATSFEGASEYLYSSQESSQDEEFRCSEWSTASSQDSQVLERERVYGLGTFAQDDADDISFLNRLLRSPSPVHFGGKDGAWGSRKRRHRHKPKKERKARKPRRSRRLRGRRSREGESEVNNGVNNDGGSGRACTCCT